LHGSPSSQSASTVHPPDGSVVVVVVVTSIVVVVVLPVVVVVLEVVVVVLVVVGVAQGQLSTTLAPTARFKHTSASVAVTGSPPFGAHTQSSCGAQVVTPTATLRIFRQSVAVGPEPIDSG
jgi:hypothetical protein